MKYINKIFIIFLLALLSLKTYSQYSKFEVNEIKNIFQNISEGKLKLPIYIYISKTDSLTLPSYFTSYNDLLQILKYRNLDSIFLEFKFLKKTERIIIQNKIMYDTSKYNIQKEWFVNYNIKILSDTITTFNKDQYRNFIKPIFFNNYTRCLFACYYGNVFNSFILKKRKNTWVVDRTYLNIEN
jgi:hypothetical protein